MAVVPKKMGLATANATETTLYTAATAAGEVLSNVIFTNITATAQTISLSVVPTGGSASDGNRVVKNLPLDPYQVVMLESLRIVMASGDFISTLSANATAVTVRATGVTL